MSNDCLYVPYPGDTLKGKVQRVFRKLSYDLWRRELNRRVLNGCFTRKNTIIDIGCGPGFLVGCLENWFPDIEIIGVDANNELLKIARSRCKSVKLIKGDACNIPLLNQSADVIFALHVIEHLPEPSKFLIEVRRVLRQNGCLIIATPNADGLGAKFMKNRWRGLSDPTHISLHGGLFWRNLITNAGFTVSRDGTTGLSGIPLLNKMPLGLLHWVPTFVFGFYPWGYGEAYVCVSVK